MGLLNARLVAERGTIFMVCVLLPVLIGMSVSGRADAVGAFAARLLAAAVPAALLSFIAAVVFSRFWNLRFASVTGNPDEDAAALIAEAAREYAGNKADERLLERARKWADGQDGRTVAGYIELRIADLRRKRAVEAGRQGASTAAVSVPQRILWSVVLLLTTSLITVLFPRAWYESGVSTFFALMILAALPLWAIGVQIALFGEPGLLTLLAGMLRRGKPEQDAESAAEAAKDKADGNKQAKVKLRKVKTSASASGWHVDESEPRPVFRLLLLLLLAAAGGVFVLREYRPPPVVLDDAITVAEAEGDEGDEGSVFDEDSDSAPPPQPVPAPPPQPFREPPREPLQAEQPGAGAPPPSYWAGLQPSGASVHVDPEQLAGSGRSLESLRATLTNNWPRIEEWFRESRARNPRLRGRVAVEIVIQPYGWVSSSTMIDSETGTDWFDAGLLDRIDALDFGRSSGRALALIYAVDFR